MIQQRQRHHRRSEIKQRYDVCSDLPQYTVYDKLKGCDLFPTRGDNRIYACKTGCTEDTAKKIADALNTKEELAENKQYRLALRLACEEIHSHRTLPWTKETSEKIIQQDMQEFLLKAKKEE